MNTTIKISDSLQETISFEQRVLSEGGSLTNRNNCVSAIPYVVLKHINPTLVLNAGGIQEDKVHALQPNLASGDFPFARAGNKTVINKDGKIEAACWNLAQNSESFTSPWSLNFQGSASAPVLTQNAGTVPHPYSGSNAVRIQCNQGVLGVGNRSRLNLTGLPHLNIGTVVTLSLWVKSFDGTNQDFTLGMSGTADLYNQIIVGSEWERVTFTSEIIGSAPFIWMGLIDSAVATTNDVLIWGVQLVVGSSARPYQKTTDRLDYPGVNYTFDTTPELVVNGNFATASDWTFSGPVSIVSGELVFAAGAGVKFARQDIGTTEGKVYRVRVTCSSYTSGSLTVFGGLGGSNIAFPNISSIGDFEVDFQATSSTAGRIFLYTSSGFEGSIDNVSVQECTPQLEQADDNTIVNNGGGIATKLSDLTYNATSDGTSGATLRPRIDFNNCVVGKYYRLRIEPHDFQGDIFFRLYNGASYIADGVPVDKGFEYIFKCTSTSNVFIAFDGTQTFNVDFKMSLRPLDSGLIIDSGRPNLLLEKDSTNLIEYSEDFSNAYWAKIGVGTGSAPIVTSNFETSPDGTVNADRVQFELNGGTTISDISYLTSSASTVGKCSIYLKSLSGNLTLYFRGGSNFTAIEVNDEWQRFILDHDGVGGNYQVGIRGGNYGGLTNSDSADLLVWGAQLEASDTPTSYIYTNGSSVTRLSDDLVKTGLSSSIGQTEGCFFIEGSVTSDEMSAISTIVNIDSGTGTNRFLFYETTSGNFALQMRVGGVDLFATNFSKSENFKVCVVYNSTRCFLVMNGVTVVDEAITFSGFAALLDEIALGAYVSNTISHPHLNVNNFWVSKEPISETLAQSITS